METDLQRLRELVSRISCNSTLRAHSHQAKVGAKSKKITKIKE